MDPQLPLETEEEQPDDLNGRLITITGKQKELLEQAVALDEQDAREAGTIGYSARLWAQVALPYRNPGNDLPEWIRRNGSLELIVTPGRTASGPEQRSSRAYPYGVIPRLLLTWMATEATITRERELELGTSMTRFLKELGLGTGGASGQRLQNQIQRLATATLVVVDNRADAFLTGSFTFADEMRLWWSGRESQEEALFPSTIKLSQRFFDSIIEAPVPVDLRALAFLRRNGGGGLPIDIYIWLAHRMYRQWMQQNPTFPIPWAYLANQFGSQYKRERDFKARFLPALRQVLLAYPEAKVIVTDDGLMLRPSPPPVTPKQLPR